MHTTFVVSEEDMQVLESVSQPAEQKATPKITLSPSQRTVLGYVQEQHVREQRGASRMAIFTALSSISGLCGIAGGTPSSQLEGKQQSKGRVNRMKKMLLGIQLGPLASGGGADHCFVRSVGLGRPRNMRTTRNDRPPHGSLASARSRVKWITNKMFNKLTICLVLTATGVFAQTKPSFEVATIKPAQPIDQAKLLAALQNGGRMPIGARIYSNRAEYLNMDLKGLLMYACGVKLFQITGPDWMSATRFDIVAKMPEGSTREDAPKMLQSLLEDRFKLTMHRIGVEHPVLALVVGKGGPKLKASSEKPVAIDEDAPLKPGELNMDGPDGPVRAKVDMTTGNSVVDMGLKGKMSRRLNPATQSMHIDFSMTTMGGFAAMLTQLMSQLGGGAPGLQVVDMTGIKGNYDGSLEISLADTPVGAPIVGAPIGIVAPGNVPVAADTGGGGASLTDAVQSIGLKLEPRNAVMDQLIVDHLEKAPTEN
jgi:uncharacterized protein (TIGR03435 family)